MSSSYFTRLNQEQILDDLQCRFIINIPDEELSSIERICFQIEQAHWYYEDFVREENPMLPSYTLKAFSAKIFQTCPLLQSWKDYHEKAFTHFLEYKVRVPVCGAMILNAKLDKILLVRGWKSTASFSFPKGKINRDESQDSCAIREVFEETGFSVESYLRPKEYVERTMRDQKVRLYIVHGVAEDTVFETKTRKEIGEIKWFRLQDLPGWTKQGANKKGKFYLVTPFMGSLKKWIEKYRKGNKKKSSTKNSSLAIVEKSAASEGYDTENELPTDMDVMFDNLNMGGGVAMTKEEEEAQKLTEQKLKALLGLCPTTSQVGYEKLSHVSTPDSSPIFIDRRPSIATQTVIDEASQRAQGSGMYSNKITVATSPIPKYPIRMSVPKTPEIDLDALLKQNLENSKHSLAFSNVANIADSTDVHKKELQALLLGFGAKDRNQAPGQLPIVAPLKAEDKKADLLNLLLKKPTPPSAPSHSISPRYDPAIVSHGGAVLSTSTTETAYQTGPAGSGKTDLMSALLGKSSQKKEIPKTVPAAPITILQKTDDQKNDLLALLTSAKAPQPAKQPTSPRFNSNEQKSMELKNLLLGPRAVIEDSTPVVIAKKSEESKVDLLKLLMSGRLVQETETTSNEEHTIKRTTSIQIDVQPGTEDLIKTLFNGNQSQTASGSSQSTPMPPQTTSSHRSYSDDPNFARAKSPAGKKDAKADLLSILMARQSN